MINLEVIGNASNRVHHICSEIEKIGVKTAVHSLPSDYKMSKIKFYKRHLLRKALIKQLESTITERNVDNTVFFASQMPTLYPPILKALSKRFATVMDIRDICQSHVYHPYLKRKIERWEQISTMNKVDVVTYTHRGFYKYLSEDIQDKRDKGGLSKLRFLTLGANKNIFNNTGRKEPLSARSINLLWFGTIHHNRYLPFWLKIMKQLQQRKADIHLTLMGYGAKEMGIRSFVDHLQNVTFLNRKFTQQQIAEHVRSADYTIGGGNKKYRMLYQIGVATKVFESLCCGTPLITIGGAMNEFNRVYGLSQINSHFDPLNHPITIAEICDEIEALTSTSNSTREKISLIADDFSHQKIALRLKDILQEVLN